MHVFLTNPLFLSKDHVACKTLEVEGDIFKTQLPCFGTLIHILHCAENAIYHILIEQKDNPDKYVKNRKHRECKVQAQFDL